MFGEKPEPRNKGDRCGAPRLVAVSQRRDEEAARRTETGG